MRFAPFPKTPTGLDRAPGGSWVATEKLHGAHFVVAAIDGVVRFGKRKEWLTGDAPFFGWPLLAQPLRDGVLALARAVGEPRVTVHGELYGGGYPHPDVAPIPGLSPVQSGVWYAPDLRWAAFAVRVGEEWLAFREVEALAAAAGLEVPPVVARGTRSELGRLAVAAQTRVPGRLGLPPIPGNVGEGLVIALDRRSSERWAVKRKIPAFDEDRFGEAEPHDPGAVGPDALREWAGRLVNPARLASARSKVGTAQAALLDEVALDVAECLQAAFPAGWAALGPTEEGALLDAIRALAERQA